MTLKPPSDLICTDEEHYHKGGQWVEYFASVCGLRRDERVLDVGSGGGRVAVPLTDYLTGGTYDGFDTSAHDVTWCRENVTPRAPNFTFRHVDIRNQTYNPAGTIDPLRFRFPYDDSSFDFVFLTSIFTHMLPVHVEHYFGEISRVLRPSGRWLATWFMLDEAALASVEDGTAAFDFRHDLGDYRVVYPERHEDAIAYPEQHVLELYERFGFDVAVDLGQWAPGRPPSPTNKDGQDIVIARPR